MKLSDARVFFSLIAKGPQVGVSDHRARYCYLKKISLRLHRKSLLSHFPFSSQLELVTLCQETSPSLPRIDSITNQRIIKSCVKRILVYLKGIVPYPIFFFSLVKTITLILHPWKIGENYRKEPNTVNRKLDTLIFTIERNPVYFWSFLIIFSSSILLELAEKHFSASQRLVLLRRNKIRVITATLPRL